jgi:DNA-binding MarR family transcriptional regulator
MEEMDLISRQPDKQDKRVVRVHLTNKGKAMREVSKDVVIRFNEFIRTNISPKKLEVFIEVMQEINALLENNMVFDTAIENKQ